MKDLVNFEGIVLRTLDYLDAAVLADVLLFDGKKTFVIKGAKKITTSTHRLGSPLTKINFLATNNPELSTLIEGTVVDNYSSIKEDIVLYNYAIVMLEKVLKFSDVIDNHELLYTFLNDCLSLINNENMMLIITMFEVKLLYLLGCNPILNKCIMCQNKAINYRLFIKLGGVVCGNCICDDGLYLNEDLTSMYKLLYTTKIKDYKDIQIDNNSLSDISMFIDNYYEYHLEFKSKAKKVIRSLNI